MFHRYCRSGLVIIGVGAGMLLSCVIQTGAICVICGSGLVILGTLLMRK